MIFSFCCLFVLPVAGHVWKVKCIRRKITYTALPDWDFFSGYYTQQDSSKERRGWRRENADFCVYLIETSSKKTTNIEFPKRFFSSSRQVIWYYCLISLALPLPIALLFWKNCDITQFFSQLWYYVRIFFAAVLPFGAFCKRFF